MVELLSAPSKLRRIPMERRINAPRPIRWEEGALSIIDQTLLPVELRYIPLESLSAVWEAIKKLRVRGAPAIGICAAFGVLVGIEEKDSANTEAAWNAVQEGAEYLATSRPTAVNLFWALDRMRLAGEKAHDQGVALDEFRQLLEAEARAVYEEELAACVAIGEHGEALLPEGCGALTHCNAGGLATIDYGTALAPMVKAHEMGRTIHVFADETRPLLQGSRLTAWELAERGIDVTVICDNMAAQVMREGKVDLVIVGADRIAANGDAANKIGTYGVSVLAAAHNVPFYVAAPSSTFDHTLATGLEIPIEERGAKEITHGFGSQTAPEGAKVYNPAFDVTPAEKIAGIITEKGILRPPFNEAILRLQSSGAA
jgi:methylthioribose-1-phosphate isomerase